MDQAGSKDLAYEETILRKTIIKNKQRPHDTKPKSSPPACLC